MIFFAGVEEDVEGVEELGLGALGAGEELDVVDHEEVDIAEAVTEFNEALLGDGLDEGVHKGFGGDVHDAEVFAEGLEAVADGLHEVGLAEADAAVDEEGVIDARAGFGDGLGGGMGEAVGLADDEIVEGVVAVEGVGGEFGGARG